MDEQDDKKFLKEMSGAVNLALLGTMSVSRTVQVFSRVPGTTGGWYLGFVLLAGLFLQQLFYQICVSNTLQFDLVSGELVGGIALFWMIVHAARRSGYRNQGIRIHSWDPGVGILYRLMPEAKPQTIGVVSDLVVAGTLALFFHLAASPVLGNWYLWSSFWVVVGHAWVDARDSWQRRRYEDAQMESEVWANTMQGKR